MINNKKVLGVIPARGGSKGLPGKNLMNLCGKPLIAWTFEAAKKSEYISRVILSSEDNAIIKVGHDHGIDVPFRRPNRLSTDYSTGVDVALHAVNEIPDYEIIVMLQPTSPLRDALDIDMAIKKMVNSNVDSCVSVNETKKSPYWMYSISKDQKLVSLFPEMELINNRQALQKTYELNGSIYAAFTNWFLDSKQFIGNNTLAYFMPPEKSIDIDTEYDFKLAEMLILSTKK